MPPASSQALNETPPMVDVGDPAVPAAVGRTRARSSGLLPGPQRDEQVQSDSDDSEMDRFCSLQLGRNASRCVTALIFMPHSHSERRIVINGVVKSLVVSK